MSFFRPIHVGLLLGLLFGACAGDDGGPSLQSFCDARAQRECASVAPRCDLNPTLHCEPVRTMACLQQAAAQMSTVRLYRAENTKPCLDLVTKTYAKTLVTAEDLRLLDVVCGRVFQGAAKQSQACQSTYDCEAALICDKNVCGPERIVAAGGFCANPGELCPSGQTCQPSGMTSSCVAKRQEMGACSASQPCIETHYCRGVCLRRLPLLSPCTAGDECDSGYCSPELGVCSSGLSFALGAPSCAAFGAQATPSTKADGGVTNDAGADVL